MRIKTVFLLLSFSLLFLLSACSENNDDIGLQKNDTAHENIEANENMLGIVSDGATLPYDSMSAKVIEVESNHVLLVEIMSDLFSDDIIGFELVSEIPDDVERGVSFEIEYIFDGAVITTPFIIYLFEGDIVRLKFDEDNERVSRAINRLDVGTLIAFDYPYYRNDVFDISSDPFVVHASGFTVLRRPDSGE